MPQYPFALASVRAATRNRLSPLRKCLVNINDINDDDTVDDNRPSAGAPLRIDFLAQSGSGESLRVPTELRELPANIAMRLVLHDGNEYL